MGGVGMGERAWVKIWDPLGLLSSEDDSWRNMARTSCRQF